MASTIYVHQMGTTVLPRNVSHLQNILESDDNVPQIVPATFRATQANLIILLRESVATLARPLNNLANFQF